MQPVRYRKMRLTALCTLLAALLASCGDKTPPPPAKALQSGVSLAEASRKFLTIEPAGESSTYASGVLPGRLAFRAQAVASIGAPVGGRVAAVMVRPGELVRAGAPLVSIQSADAAGSRAALETAMARHVAAEENLKRQNEMIAQGVGLELERFEAQTKVREAKAELDRARRASALIGAGQGDVVSVRAPGAGVVMSVKAAIGAMVAPGADALVEIADPSGLWVVADVAESDAAKIQKGQAVSVSVPGADKRFDGVVDGVGSRVDAETRRLPIYIVLKGDLRALTPGMNAEVKLLGKTPAFLTLPVTAVLIKDGKRRIVYVERADGRFEAREVRTGTSTAGRVTILEGLAPGERVVVKGALLLDSAAEQLL